MQEMRSQSRAALVPHTQVRFAPGKRHCYRGTANIVLQLLNATTATVLDPCIELVVRGNSISACEGWKTERLLDRYGRPILRLTWPDRRGLAPNEMIAAFALDLPIIERSGVWAIGRAICKSLSNMPDLPVVFMLAAKSIMPHRVYLKVSAAEIAGSIIKKRVAGLPFRRRHEIRKLSPPPQAGETQMNWMQRPKSDLSG